MWDPNPDHPVRNPFTEPIPDPTTDPGAAPRVFLAFNESWRPILAAAFLSAMQPASWDVGDPASLLDVQIRAEQLFHRVGTARRYLLNTVNVTIHAGTAGGSTAVTFSPAFAATPVVVVSCDNADLIASSGSVSVSGFNAVLTANVNLPTDVTATVSYLVGPAN